MLSGLEIYSILPSIMAFRDKLLIYKDIVTIWFLSTILNFVDTKETHHDTHKGSHR